MKALKKIKRSRKIADSQYYWTVRGVICFDGSHVSEWVRYKIRRDKINKSELHFFVPQFKKMHRAIKMKAKVGNK